MNTQERLLKFEAENSDLSLRTSHLDCQIAIRRLLADLAASREEIARPKEDSERINVVEEREWLLIPTRKHLSDGSGYEIWWSVQDRRTRRQITHPYGNPRAAIDAARAGGTR